MSSPRSSWTGSITLDLLNVPITLGKATRENREKSIKTLCECHKQPIDKSERCRVTQGPISGKLKGVDLGGDKYHPFAPDEWNSIEDTTKDSALEILDVQPVSELPLAFGQGTYYVRAVADDRASANGVQALVLALAQMGAGAVVKLCKSAKQDLAILHPYKGMLVLTLVPFIDELQLPGDQERAHMKVEAANNVVERLVQLFREIQDDKGFQYAAYEDKGLALRQDAVDRVLKGEKLDEKKEDEKPQMDIMGALMASIDNAKAKEVA